MTEKTFVVLFTPRSGSTLVAADLSWNAIGCGMEIFNSKSNTFKTMDFSFLEDDLPFSDYKKMQSFLSRNNIFGFKLNYYQLFMLYKYFNCAAVDNVLSKLFGDVSIIRVRRLNKVKQAISLIRASYSNQWCSADVADVAAINKLEAMHDEELFKRIIGRMGEVQREDYGIDVFLTKFFSGRVLDVVYEDYIKDREASIRAIFEFLGVEKSKEITLSKNLEAQSNEWSRSLADRYEQWLLSENYLPYSESGKIIV